MIRLPSKAFCDGMKSIAANMNWYIIGRVEFVPKPNGFTIYTALRNAQSLQEPKEGNS